MKWGIMVMKSKTSFINRGVLRNDFKSFGWISGVYLLGMLLAVPLNILMLYSQEQHYRIINENAYLRIFNYGDSGLVIVLLVLVPILTGLWLFRYLQADKTADMIHALPVKRETLYSTHILSGIIYLFIPLIITALVSWILVGGLGIESVGGLHILKWLGISLLLNLLFFMATVFTGICTGISTLQGILTLILLVLPTGLWELLIMTGDIYIYGFASEYYTGNVTFSPLLRMTDLAYSPLKAGEVAGYLIAAAAFYLIGRYLYQRRHVERAGSAITFNVLRPVFKYGVTFCVMLLAGAYFYESQQNSISWAYFGYLLGSVLAFILIEMLLTKSLRVFNGRAAKSYGLYLLLMVVLIAGLNYDFTGYEKRQPALAEVESIYMDSGFSSLKHAAAVRPAYAPYDYEYPVQPQPTILKEPANIANIHALHQRIIANRQQDQSLLHNNPGKHPMAAVYLAYNLKNGQHMYRQFIIPSAGYKDLLKPIYESREYKELHNPIFRTDLAKVHFISIRANEANRYVNLSDPAQIAQAIAVLRQDLLQQSYEEMTDEKAPWADITIIMNNHSNIHLSWEKSFSGFEEWLIHTGLSNQARLIPKQDLDYAIVDLGPDDEKGDRDKYYDKSSTALMKDLEKKPGILKITDVDQLETCIRTYTNSYKPKYRIYYLQKNGSIFSGGFDEENVPDFVKKHFNNNQEAVSSTGNAPLPMRAQLAAVD